MTVKTLYLGQAKALVFGLFARASCEQGLSNLKLLGISRESGSFLSFGVYRMSVGATGGFARGNGLFLTHSPSQDSGQQSH